MPGENLESEFARMQYAEIYGPEVDKLGGELFTGFSLGRQPKLSVRINVGGLTETVQDKIVALLPVSYEGYLVEIKLMEQGELDIGEEE